MSRYIQGRLIGSGTYGDVYEATDMETSCKVALKKIKLTESEGMPGTALREISILKKLKHDNVICLHSVIHTDKILTMVFELMDCDLKEYITNKDVNHIVLVHQLVAGVRYLHTQKIIHRDLKPQNILVNCNGQLKIADFGLARSVELKTPPYSCEVVTLWYRSPELLYGSTDYSYYVDIWSLGCIIYEMFVLEPLFPGVNKMQVLEMINGLIGKGQKQTQNFFRRKMNVPEFFTDIIVRCLSYDHKYRLTADEAYYILDYNYNKIDEV